jgi:RimJ/RimL family protein N-acetyltransferase
MADHPSLPSAELESAGKQIIIKSPLKCDQHELESFEALVRMGEEVAGDGLTERIRNAAFLLFLRNADGGLIGVSALKRPNPGYRVKVFKSAHSQLRPEDYGLELGWIYLVEAERGNKLSHILLEKLLLHLNHERVYATTREHNLAMIRTNERYGFRREGNPYPAANRQYNLILFVR